MTHPLYLRNCAHFSSYDAPIFSNCDKKKHVGEVVSIVLHKKYGLLLVKVNFLAGQLRIMTVMTKPIYPGLKYIKYILHML